MEALEFKIETFPGRIFSGFSNNKKWNGWECPYFSFDEAQNIADLQNQLSGNAARYDKEKSVFIFNYEDNVEQYAGEDYDGVILYPIGSGSWIWEKAGIP